MTVREEGRRRARQRGVTALIGTFIAWWLIFAVRMYQVILSPLLGGHCRFRPTCSQYFIEAVGKYGPWRGAWKGLKRIARCHPFGGSGDDPP